MSEAARTQNQIKVEQYIGLTRNDAAFINANRNTPVVSAFLSFYEIQASTIDPLGLELLKESLADVRKTINAAPDAAAGSAEGVQP